MRANISTISSAEKVYICSTVSPSATTSINLSQSGLRLDVGFESTPSEVPIDKMLVLVYYAAHTSSTFSQTRVIIEITRFV